MASERNKRVLVVVSSYAPAMIADMHRARMLAWELPKCGWDVEILAPGSEFQHSDCLDVDSLAFFNRDTKVHFAKPQFGWTFSKLGMRSIGWRALRSLQSEGMKLFRSSRPYDLIYISTTQFCLFTLGAYWKRRAGIPYVLDFHDPYYKSGRAKIETTRHRFKATVNQLLSRHMEALAVLRADGIVAVSPNYIELLKHRYRSRRPSWLGGDRYLVSEFASSESDLAEASKTLEIVGNRSEILINYVGAGGGIMFRSFSLICSALASLRASGNSLVDRVRLRLYGTTYNWKPGDGYPLGDLAKSFGLGGIVTEYPSRVSYRKSLELLLEGDGAIVLGVDDVGYMPSKLYTYALSGKPLLASLHRRSPAFGRIEERPEMAHLLWFDDDAEIELTSAVRILSNFLDEAANRQKFDRKNLLRPFLSPAMAKRHAELFSTCVAAARQ